MKREAHTDVGTVLQPDEFCGVWSPTEGWSFLVPPKIKDDDEVPEDAIALIAAVMRIESDEDFRDELVDWLLKGKRA